MATGSASGHIALWDLEKRKLRCQMREAHGTAVSGMQCLPSEPLMVTSAADNTLKVQPQSSQTRNLHHLLKFNQSVLSGITALNSQVFYPTESDADIIHFSSKI